MIETAVLWLLKVLAAPTVGLTSVFLISFVSATLLPLGSEPAVFAVVKANEAMFWPAVLVATLGNTLGGAVDYLIGYRAKVAFAKERQSRWFSWLARYGAKTMLMSWLPGVGDPLCTLAGWLHLPFWPSVGYMAVGKLARYVVMTASLLYVPDGVWKRIGELSTQLLGLGAPVLAAGRGRPGQVFGVGHLLHPFDRLAIECLLDRDMGHRGARGGAVPVLVAGRAPYHVAGADLDDRLALALGPAAAGGDDQRLSQRMRMPGRARAGLEGHAGHRGAGRRRRRIERIDPDAAGKVFFWALHRGLGSCAFEFHACSFC
jgi:membrane protein YqaA with SNARE-associated domain